eukprot:7129493-Karenia_brevis.AAC.1
MFMLNQSVDVIEIVSTNIMDLGYESITTQTHPEFIKKFKQTLRECKYFDIFMMACTNVGTNPKTQRGVENDVG